MSARKHNCGVSRPTRTSSTAGCFAFRTRGHPHIRDLAIAQKVFTVYGGTSRLRLAMAWLEPLSPILGWNGGDEFANTDLSTGYGHIQTATNWCMNLPVLMAGTEKLESPQSDRF